MNFQKTVPTLLCAFAVFSLAAALRYPLAHIPLERDEGEYAYIAQQWRQGHIPYKDSFDQKPPGVFVFYYLIERFVGQTAAVIHWSTQAYTYLTLLLLAFIGAYFFDLLTGFLAAVFAVLMTTDLSVLGNAANTEVFFLLPATACLFLLLWQLDHPSVVTAFLLGLLWMAMLWIKQVGAVYVIPIAGFLLFSPQRSKQFLGFSLGVISGMLPVLYWIHHRAFHEFLDCVVGYNLSYALNGNPHAVFKIVVLPYFSVFWPLYGVLAISLYLLFKRSKTTSPTSIVVVWCWFFFSLWSVCLSGFFRMHYFMLLSPVVSLLAAHAFSRVIRHKQFFVRAIGAFGVSAACLWPFIAHAWYYGREGPDVKSKMIYGHNPFSESPAIGEFIQHLTPPNQRLFIFGSEPQILYYAKRQSASRYIFMYPATLATPSAKARQHDIVAELNTDPPAVIVTVFSWFSFLSTRQTPDFLFERMAKWIPAHYEMVGLIPDSLIVPNALFTYDGARRRWPAGTTLYPFPKGFLLAVWRKK